MTFADLWRELEPLGRDPQTGGYRRYSWTEADAQCRAWFTAQAERRGLTVEPDRNGNLWAWWGQKRTGAIATGSHLDSVPDGGGFDGALGVVSALAAVDLLKEKNFYPERSVVLVTFTEEEGGRFGVPCLGSRLMTGVMDPERARALADGQGVTLAEAMAAAGFDPARIGPDEQRLSGLAAFVELHVEQGRALAPLGAPVGIARSIWPHDRWRLVFTGRPDHAGTTRLADRHDPMLPYASTVLAARQAAAALGSLATFGKVIAEPGGTNGISSSVTAWLDARAPDEAILAATIATIRSAAEKFSTEHNVTLTVRQESHTPLVRFDLALSNRLATTLANPALTSAHQPPPDSPRPAGARAANRRRPRRRLPRRQGAVGHAVRAQPDRRLALARRARRTGGLRGRGARARGRARGPGGPPVTRRWLAELAWLPGQGVCYDVLIEASGDRFTSVTPDAPSIPSDAEHLSGLTLPGFANAHSHAFHRALRASTQADGGRSGPGASACTRWRRGSTRTATVGWPAPCTPRWRWPGSAAWGSSTTCTTSRTPARTPTPTRWAGR